MAICVHIAVLYIVSLLLLILVRVRNRDSAIFKISIIVHISVSIFYTHQKGLIRTSKGVSSTPEDHWIFKLTISD